MLIIWGLFGYLLTQIQKPSECGEIILHLNREGNKLDEESKVINGNIAKYNRQISSYKQEHFPNSSYTQQIEKMESDLKQKSKIHNNKAESLKAKCNLAIEYR